jgi:hypothetical protein
LILLIATDNEILDFTRSSSMSGVIRHICGKKMNRKNATGQSGAGGRAGRTRHTCEPLRASWIGLEEGSPRLGVVRCLGEHLASLELGLGGRRGVVVIKQMKTHEDRSRS